MNSTIERERGTAGALEQYPAYRESGDWWLGEVPAHWEVLRLKSWLGINERVLSEDTDPDYARGESVGPHETLGLALEGLTRLRPASATATALLLGHRLHSLRARQRLRALPAGSTAATLAGTRETSS